MGIHLGTFFLAVAGAVQVMAVVFLWAVVVDKLPTTCFGIVITQAKRDFIGRITGFLNVIYPPAPLLSETATSQTFSKTHWAS